MNSVSPQIAQNAKPENPRRVSHDDLPAMSGSKKVSRLLERIICRPYLGEQAGLRRSIPVVCKCPLWVKSGHFGVSVQCPLYPQKRTSCAGRESGDPTGFFRVKWLKRYSASHGGKRVANPPGSPTEIMDGPRLHVGQYLLQFGI